MITLVQIVGVLFGLFMLYFTRLHYHRREFSRYQYYAWQLLWLGLIVSMLFPQTFDAYAQPLGIARVFDLYAIIAFIFLTYLTYHNYVQIQKLENKLDSEVRYRAINEHEDAKKKIQDNIDEYSS